MAAVTMILKLWSWFLNGLQLHVFCCLIKPAIYIIYTQASPKSNLFYYDYEYLKF